MSIKVESILPFILIGGLIFTFYFNSRPPSHIGDRKVIAPELEAPKLFRDEGVVDGKVQIKHLPSNDTLNLELYDGYFLLPPGEDNLPLGVNGGKLWEFKYTRPTYWIDPRFEIGVYGGFLDGPKEGTDIKPLDVGIKLSPVRLFFDSATIDGLISNQAAGLGISVYPSPAKFGVAWRNVGLGYGRMYSYDDGVQRNLFYFTVSSHF